MVIIAPSGADGHIRFMFIWDSDLYFIGKCIRLYDMHFSSLTLFLDHITGNRENVYWAIVQTPVQYHSISLKFRGLSCVTSLALYGWANFA